MAEQHEHKLSRIRAEFERAQVRLPDSIPFIHAGSALGYRNRIRLRLDDGVPSFFNEEKSLSCAALSEKLRALLLEVCALSSEHRGCLRRFAHLEIREPDERGWSSLCLGCGSDTGEPEASTGMPELRRALWERKCLLGVLGSTDNVLTQRFAIDGNTFALVPLGRFLQVNPAANRLLVEQIVTGAKARGARSFLDVYSGSGNFALALASAGLRGVGVEVDAIAVDAAERAAVQQRLACEFLAMPSSELAALTHEPFDLVIADPPRAGLKEALPAVWRLVGRHLALCSCNPASLARDVRELSSAGARLEALIAVDMFPSTEHVECVAWLGRGVQGLG